MTVPGRQVQWGVAPCVTRHEVGVGAHQHAHHLEVERGRYTENKMEREREVGRQRTRGREVREIGTHTTRGREVDRDRDTDNEREGGR